MRELLAFERFDGGNASIDGVAIVGAAAAVEPPLFIDRRPRAQITPPTGEFRLLVQVAVQQHRLARGRRVPGSPPTGRHLEKQHRRTPFQANDLQPQAGDPAGLDPGRRIAHHGIDVPVLGPLRVEQGRLGGNLDVLAQLAEDVLIPTVTHLVEGARGIKGGGGKACVHGKSCQE